MFFLSRPPLQADRPLFFSLWTQTPLCGMFLKLFSDLWTLWLSRPPLSRGALALVRPCTVPQRHAGPVALPLL